MAEHNFEDWPDYVGKEFESRRDSAITLKVLEVGNHEFWVEDHDGYRYSVDIVDFDRYWQPPTPPTPKVGELWRRKNPYQGACEILSVADDYVVYTYDGRKANPLNARTIDNFLRNYELPKE